MIASCFSQNGSKITKMTRYFAISEKDFVGKLLRFKAHEFSDQEIIEGISSLSNTKSILSCNGRIYP